MAITKSIVDMMGGTIEVKSEQGEGTEFVINICFALQETQEKDAALQKEQSLLQADSISEGDTPSQTNAENAPEAKKELDFSTMRLLLVDDVDVNRELATMILESEGFSVETAVNGKEAVEKVSSADFGYYNAVLMDIQMPVMNGYEASLAIRALEDKKKANIPIVAMTANAFSEDVQKAKESGMNAHVAKPIDVENLMQTLRSVLS